MTRVDEKWTGRGRLPLALAVLAIALTILAQPAFADVVRLKNGDRISGTIVKMAGGKLSLKTGYAGVLAIAWDQVAGIESEKPLTLDMGGGKLVSGAAAPAGEGRVRLGSGPRAPVVELASVAAVNPAGNTRLRIKGQVNLGADTWSGNTNKERWDLDGQVSLRRGVNRFTLGAESHRETNKGKDTVDKDLGYAEYNRFIDQKWYGLANGRASRDPFKGIRSRYGLGAGLGYQLWDDDITSLSMELGPTYFDEDTDLRGHRQWTAARWALEYDRWFWGKRVQFFHQHELFVRVDDTDQYFYNTRTGLRLPLGWGMVTSLVYAFDWDNDPDPGREQEDSRLTLKLGYSW